MNKVLRAVKAYRLEQGYNRDNEHSHLSNPYDAIKYPTKFTTFDTSTTIAETKTEVSIRYICYMIMTYGIVGGLISFLATGFKIFAES